MYRRYRVDGARLKQILTAHGFASLAEFAKAHQVSRATLHNYLRGQSPISSAYYQLCDLLAIDPIDLLVPATGELAIPHVQEIAPILKACCRRYPHLAIGLFGSRARGTARAYSDWDLGLTRGARGLAAMEFLALKRLVDDLAENLPRMVDLINLDAAPIWFMQEQSAPPRLLMGCEASWHYFLGVLHGAQKAA